MLIVWGSLKLKTCSYFVDDSDENKKQNALKKCVIKVNFEDKIKIVFCKKYTGFLKNNRLILKSQQRLRSQKHNVFTEEVNLIATDDKSIQSKDSIDTYKY